jgi:hypothetical protein
VGKAVAHAEGKSAELKCCPHDGTRLDAIAKCRNLIFPADGFVGRTAIHQQKSSIAGPDAAALCLDS